MFLIKVKNKTLKVPNRLSEIPLYKGIEIINIFKESHVQSYDEKLAIISSLTELDPVIFANISEKSIDDIFNHIKPIFFKDQFMTLKTFLFNDELFGVMDFDKMTVLEFIDIELNLKQNNNFNDIHNFLAIICRKVVRKNNNIKNILNNIKLRIFIKNIVPQIYKSYVIKEYDAEDIQKNSYLFNIKMDAESALGLYFQYMDFRNKLINNFKNLFERVDIPEEDKDQYDEVPIFKKPYDFEEQWGLYSTLCNVSSSVMEIDYWKKKNIKEFLLYLSYLKEKNEQAMIERRNINQNMINYGR